VKYELKFLDGPGGGRSFELDKVPKVVWLCSGLKGRFWRIEKPDDFLIEATYDLKGYAPRLDGRALIVYGVRDD
jgi:hypothetical protein